MRRIVQARHKAKAPKGDSINHLQLINNEVNKKFSCKVQADFMALAVLSDERGGEQLFQSSTVYQITTFESVARAAYIIFLEVIVTVNNQSERIR